jgi:hypothetical protein
MTEYEIGIEEGTHVEMNGMDWLMLDVVIGHIVENNGEQDDDSKETLNDMWLEIKHKYRNDDVMMEKLEKLKEKLNV